MGEDERRSAERKGEEAMLRGRWPAVKRETRTMELELRGEMWGSDMPGGGGGGGCCQKNGEESDGVRVYFWFRFFCIFLMLSKLPPLV